MNRRLLMVLVATALVLASCRGDDDDGPVDAERIEREETDADLIAQVASYDLEVDTPQRFLVGLLTPEQEVIGGGEVELSFGFRGTEEAPSDTSTIAFETTADYILLPGQDGNLVGAKPSVVDPSEAAGVYRATDVSFDRAGSWAVRVQAEVGGETRTADATFEVIEDSGVVEVGEPAPRTENHLPGAEGVPPAAVDSRAQDDGEVPDPELHGTTVAAALDRGRPTVIVVSTPIYCVSRFCGPITDEVATLARDHGDDVSFVHLEVWRDFEGRAINKAAAEWVYPDGAEGLFEPWVFVVGADGIVTHRFDNVASAEELSSAIAEVKR